MRKFHALYFLVFLLPFSVSAQTDSLPITGIFDRIAAAAKSYQPDTTAPPRDRLTKKINQLRELRGGFNIQEAMVYKVEESLQKKEMTAEAAAAMKQQIQNGEIGRKLGNAVVWIYRREFTYPEVKKLVKFYKSSAGQKFASQFPVILVESAMAAAFVQDKIRL